MRRPTRIKIKLRKPRSPTLNSLLVEKSKSGGIHVLKKDKRSQAKGRRDLEREIDNLIGDKE
jgi:hypothetical protein